MGIQNYLINFDSADCWLWSFKSLNLEWLDIQPRSTKTSLPDRLGQGYSAGKLGYDVFKIYNLLPEIPYKLQLLPEYVVWCQVKITYLPVWVISVPSAPIPNLPNAYFIQVNGKSSFSLSSVKLQKMFSLVHKLGERC